MAGHMGDEKVTVRNLLVLESDPAKGILLVEGSVPGGKNALLRIRKSARKAREVAGIARAEEPAE
jgi:large subunit ribosomal protein L3